MLEAELWPEEIFSWYLAKKMNKNHFMGLGWAIRTSYPP
jgi:hypothetical protein